MLGTSAVGVHIGIRRKQQAQPPVWANDRHSLLPVAKDAVVNEAMKPLLFKAFLHTCLCIGLCVVSLGAGDWFVGSSTAWANGRYPKAGQFCEDPSDTKHLMVRATYGLLQSHDGGQTWQWICETAANYADATDPYLAIAGGGRAVLATYDGLDVGSADGCAFAVWAGDWGQAPAVDLVQDRSNPKHLVTLLATSTGLQLAATTDGGATWNRVGQPLPGADNGLTLELAPSRPERIYVSAQAGAQLDKSVLAVSDDGGTSWTSLPLAATDVVTDYLAGVDPQQPDVVYIRRIHQDFVELLRSQDGGKTLQSVFSTTESLSGFAVAPDGSQIAVGTSAKSALGATDDHLGLWVADASTLQFNKANGIAIQCLTWTAQGLFLCTDDRIYGYSVGRSSDAGKSVLPLLRAKSLKPLQCGGTSAVDLQCPKRWPSVQAQLGIEASATSSGAMPTANAKSSGCSAAPPSTGHGFGLLLAVMVAGLCLRRRRRVSFQSQSIVYACLLLSAALGCQGPTPQDQDAASDAPALYAADGARISQRCPGGPVGALGVGKACQHNADCLGQAAVVCLADSEDGGPDFCSTFCFGLESSECGDNAICIVRGDKPSVCAPIRCANEFSVPMASDVTVQFPCNVGQVNPEGVGKACSTDADCAVFGAARTCPVTIRPENPNWCSMLCVGDSDCGNNAFCWRRPTVEQGVTFTVASCAPTACRIKQKP